MLEDIRAWAQQRLGEPDGMLTREQYIALVRAYAVGKHGARDEVRMHAERTARYLWASRAKPADG